MEVLDYFQDQPISADALVCELFAAIRNGFLQFFDTSIKRIGNIRRLEDRCVYIQ